MSNTIRTIIVSGYLGAGKTTFLNAIITQLQNTVHSFAVIINEFGKLGVDAALLKPGRHKTYEINKGSIFCICTKTDLMRVFYDVAENVRPDLLLIEASGIAEPRDLTSVLSLPTLVKRFSPVLNVCIVDPLTFPKIAPVLAAGKRQVSGADIILLNKVDLVCPDVLDNIQQQITEINPDAILLRTSKARIPLAHLLDRENEGSFNLPPRATAPSGLCSISFCSDRIMKRRHFYDFLDRNRDHILRAKGIVNFPEGPLFVEMAAGRLHSRPATGIKLSENVGTHFVVITEGCDEDYVRSALYECEVGQNNDV